MCISISLSLSLSLFNSPYDSFIFWQGQRFVLVVPGIEVEKDNQGCRHCEKDDKYEKNCEMILALLTLKGQRVMHVSFSFLADWQKYELCWGNDDAFYTLK